MSTRVRLRYTSRALRPRAHTDMRETPVSFIRSPPHLCGAKFKPERRRYIRWFGQESNSTHKTVDTRTSTDPVQTRGQTAFHYRRKNGTIKSSESVFMRTLIWNINFRFALYKRYTVKAVKRYFIPHAFKLYVFEHILKTRLLVNEGLEFLTITSLLTKNSGFWLATTFLTALNVN